MVSLCQSLSVVFYVRDTDMRHRNGSVNWAAFNADRLCSSCTHTVTLLAAGAPGKAEDESVSSLITCNHLYFLLPSTQFSSFSLSLIFWWNSEQLKCILILTRSMAAFDLFRPSVSRSWTTTLVLLVHSFRVILVRNGRQSSECWPLICLVQTNDATCDVPPVRNVTLGAFFYSVQTRDRAGRTGLDWVKKRTLFQPGTGQSNNKWIIFICY
jgi:hypothetical protein